MKKFKQRARKTAQLEKLVIRSEQFLEAENVQRVQLFPVGMTVGADQARPMMLLRDESGQHILPVNMNPLEAGVALGQSNKALAPMTPHRVTELLLKNLGVQIEKCLFVEIKSMHQYVVLKFKGNKNLNGIKVRADEAMSLCLHLGVPFFASPEFIQRSRTLTAELDDLSKGVLRNPGVLNRQQSYMM